MKNLRDILLNENYFDNPTDNIIVYDGPGKLYAIINTSDYSSDEGVAVMIEVDKNLSESGFSDAEISKIKALSVGESSNDFEMDGVVVVRMQ